MFTLALLTVPGQPRSLEPSPVPYWPAFTLESLQASQFEPGAWFAARHWSTLTITVQNNGISTDMVCVSLVSYVSVCLYTFSNSNKEIYKKAARRIATWRKRQSWRKALLLALTTAVVARSVPRQLLWTHNLA